MDEKKEIQKNIFENIHKDKITKEEFLSVLKLIAPGTSLRVALDGVLKIGKGALIVIENQNLLSLLDGGFRFNTKFTPQKLVELAKMDGAIVLSSDLKKINYANVLLIPDVKIKTNQTGTRHKAAERTAKQAGTITIAISERKHEITLYYKSLKHLFLETSELLRRANEYIYFLEKQKELFEKSVERLTRFELRKITNMDNVLSVIQKGKIIQKISDELRRYIVEIGKDADVLKIRLKELTLGVEKETDSVIRDYSEFNLNRTNSILNSFSFEELFDKNKIYQVLSLNESISEKTKGWRILSMTSLENKEIALLIQSFSYLEKILLLQDDLLKPILEEKTNSFIEEIENIKEKFNVK